MFCLNIGKTKTHKLDTCIPFVFNVIVILVKILRHLKEEKNSLFNVRNFFNVFLLKRNAFINRLINYNFTNIIK